MKKIFLLLLGSFLTIGLFTQAQATYAQEDCSFACRVPGTPTCEACLDSQGKSIPGSGDSSQKTGSTTDIHGDCGENGINTAIGCLDVLGSQEEFLGDLLRWAIGVGGGIAFLLIVYAGFMIMTSSGNPDRLKAGQELLTSAISGLILLIFSVFILNLIGVKILAIPEFGGPDILLRNQPR